METFHWILNICGGKHFGNTYLLAYDYWIFKKKDYLAEELRHQKNKYLLPKELCIVSTIKKKTLWLVSAKMVKILIWKCAGDCEPSLKIQKKYYLFFSCLVAVFLYGFSCAGLSWIELKLPDKGKTIDFFFLIFPKLQMHQTILFHHPKVI